MSAISVHTGNLFSARYLLGTACIFLSFIILSACNDGGNDNDPTLDDPVPMERVTEIGIEMDEEPWNELRHTAF